MIKVTKIDSIYLDINISKARNKIKLIIILFRNHLRNMHSRKTSVGASLERNF